MINITSHGALAGADLAPQTAAIQAALDACAAQGGGTVLVPAGTYRIATLFLRSYVTLQLENGAMLLGSEQLEDYPDLSGGFTDAVGQKRGRCLIYAQGLTGVAITGQGTIDGSGSKYTHEQDNRPFLVRFVDCRDVQMTGVTLQNSPGWVSHYLGCENVLVQGVTIRSNVNGNNDGIDIDSCRRVRIAHCDIVTGDDAICIKSTRATSCENITVTGCVISSVWGALKLGTESAGDFRNIVISDCVIYDTHGGGLKIISMDGCRMENVLVSNIVMDRVSGPIFVRLGSRLRRYYADQPERPVGILRNVTIRNIVAHVWEEGYLLYGKYPRKAGIIITGIPGHCVEDLTLSEVKVVFPGGEQIDSATLPPVPEQEAEYPEFPMFHPNPAWGFYLRHVRNLSLRNVSISTVAPDTRTPIYVQDVAGLVTTDFTVQGQSLTPNDLMQIPS